jgi:hypothetical protein
MSYFKEKKSTTTSVSWGLLDKDGNEFDAHSNYPCYSPITYSAIPANCVTIECYHSASMVPYELDAIRRWVEEITLLGFPCRLVDEDKKRKGYVTICIDLKDYKKKMHVSCALQLVRCLFERGIFSVPDLYLQKIDKDPKASVDARFLLLQDAHKEISGYANSNHMCTYAGNGESVARKTFFERIEKHSSETYSGSYIGLSPLWRKEYKPGQSAW